MEVIFIRYRICEEVAKIALEEDVNVIGMSFYSSGYSNDIPIILNTLKEKGKKVTFLVGGIIPSDEIPKLKEIGVDAFFGPDTPTEEVIKCIRVKE